MERTRVGTYPNPSNTCNVGLSKDSVTIQFLTRERRINNAKRT